MSASPKAADLRRSITRTLAASGYAVTRGFSHPSYIEIHCERVDVFGCRLMYYLAVTDEPRLPANHVAELARRSAAQGRSLVVLSREGGPGQLVFEDFFLRLGGEVPRWRALTEKYHGALRAAARNRLPDDYRGPAWRLLEDLAADGLEFAFGRRARRLGGRHSGSRVPDVLLLSPDDRLYLLDAKASRGGFDASWPNLRALAEYVDQQRERQRGSYPVAGALVVSSQFKQDEQGLMALAVEFQAEHGLMLTFLTAETLSGIVSAMRENVDIRSALQWRRVFQGGAVSAAAFAKELQRARSQRVSP